MAESGIAAASKADVILRDAGVRIPHPPLKEIVSMDDELRDYFLKQLNNRCSDVTMQLQDIQEIFNMLFMPEGYVHDKICLVDRQLTLTRREASDLFKQMSSLCYSMRNMKVPEKSSEDTKEPTHE